MSGGQRSLPAGLLIIISLLLALLVCCSPEESGTPSPTLSPSTPPGETEPALPTRSPLPSEPSASMTPTRTPMPTLASPTPNPTRSGLPELEGGGGLETHVVQYGESLGLIALEYGTTVQALMESNDLTDSDAIYVGQVLLVPAGQLPIGPADKLIPDSELVYGPAFSHFDVATMVANWGGYLLDYVEEVEGSELNGPEIVQLVAQRFSVGPRVLLALLELQAGWVTEPAPAEETLFYPMGKVEEGWDGLFIQLSWTANQLNRGLYGWDAHWLRNVELGDGTLVQLAPELNPGTVAVQAFLALHSPLPVWESQVARDGSFMTVYRAFFGSPFQYAIEPLIPADLVQPEMHLPWKAGDQWYLSSGPHGGWGSYSGWAALDFVPEGEQLGCTPSEDWVRAAAPGRVLRSENGEVMVDLDDDGFQGTGWAVLYMHIVSDERVPVGTWLEAGDKIGHPSCEGGFSNGTHVHIARLYNGRWMEADGPVPFVMDGWVPVSYGIEYQGALVKGDLTCVAEGWERKPDLNGIIAGE